MGTFRVRIEVGDPAGQRFEPVEALVDTGASHTVFPGSFLSSLGVQPDERAIFRLADGRMVECDVGEAWIRIDGRRRMTVVVFGDEGIEPLLGAVTLEEFRLAADPVQRRLVSVPGLLM